MTHAHPPRAVHDADILYSRVLHELFGRLGVQLRLLDAFWSEQLLDETQRSLIAKKQLPPEAARRWVDYLRQSFPNGRADLEHADLPDLTTLTRDPGDHHICALAIASEAEYLFTHDRGYLQDGLSGYGIQVQPPDAFLTDALDADPDGILARLQLQAATWTGGRPIQHSTDTITAPAPRPSLQTHEHDSRLDLSARPRRAQSRTVCLDSPSHPADVLSARRMKSSGRPAAARSDQALAPGLTPPARPAPLRGIPARYAVLVFAGGANLNRRPSSIRSVPAAARNPPRRWS